MFKGNLRAIFVVLGACILFLVAGARELFELQGQDVFVTLVENAPSQNMKPVGEIYSGVVLRQEVIMDARKVNESMLKINPCVQVFFATYGDRSRTGRLHIALEVGQDVEKEIVDVNDLSDNSFYEVCFDKFSVNQLLNVDELSLILEGKESPKGKAVTAWSTKDTTVGRVFGNKGRVSLGSSLVYRIGYRSPVSDRRVINGIILFSIYAFSLIILYWGIFYKFNVKDEFQK